MGRLCERPGCSEHAAVAYGMRPEDLVFWLDKLEAHHGQDSGVLCLRHADSMVVPRGWTLDDLREPDLHLFRPPAPAPADRNRSRRGVTRPRVTVEQLALGVDPIVQVPDTPAPPAPVATPAPPAAAAPAPAPAVVDDALSIESSIEEHDADVPWTPTFDTADDLGGLLSARSPLLARAFRGDDRPR